MVQIKYRKIKDRSVILNIIVIALSVRLSVQSPVCHVTVLTDAVSMSNRVLTSPLALFYYRK